MTKCSFLFLAGMPKCIGGTGTMGSRSVTLAVPVVATALLDNSFVAVTIGFPGEQNPKLFEQIQLNISNYLAN